MQIPFLILYGVSLVAFSFFVTRVVRLLPFLVARSPIPLSEWLLALGGLALFLLSFVGTGLYLYERERDEGRVVRRIGIYEWLLSRRRPRRDVVSRISRRPSDKV